MKVHVVIGTRPQYVKWAALEKIFRREFSVTLVDTGQHYDDNLSTVFFRDFGLMPTDVNLGIGSGTQGEQTGRMMIALERFWLKQYPDFVVVIGDTNSALSGALVAAKLRFPIGHLEAGIRSFNRNMPEEINRMLADHVSTLLWCPTKTAVNNLQREGIKRGVSWTGDVTYELLCSTRHRLKPEKALKEFSVEKKRYAVMTIHRQENTSDPKRLREILLGISRSPCPVLFFIHPRTRMALRKHRLKLPKQVVRVDPFGYIQFLSLVAGARYVVTDSGGLMREAAWLKIPCLVVRDETEWPELVQHGWNKLVGASSQNISWAIGHPTGTSSISGLFGTLRNSQRVVDSLVKWWRDEQKR